jgi:Flp pilus assembly protein TadG
MSAVQPARHPQRGASAVEFAVVLPVLILILFGTIEFGLFMFNKQVITNASREGARAGIIYREPRLTGGEITAIVNDYLGTKLVSFGATAVQATTLVDYSGGQIFGQDLMVRVSYPYNFLVLPGFVTPLAGGLTITGETVMRYE